MAWTSPKTAVPGGQVTASDFNTYVRDNLLETAPAVATTGSRLIVATGVNTVTEREVSTASVNTSQTTTSTSYANLATVGPAVTVTTGTRAVIFINARMSNNTQPNSCFSGVNITGASTIAPADNTSIQFNAAANDTTIRLGAVFVRPDLTAGSNTFTMQYRVTGGTGTFHRRAIIVMAF